MLRYPFLYEMIAKKQVKFVEFDLLSGCGGRI